MIRKLAAPLRRQVLDELRQSIISGRLAPGSRLVERELISMMGVSRTVIREALRQLETEGLIAIIPNKGPVVRELTVAEAKDLYAIRAVLEGLAARLFVENADAAQVGKLEQELNATEKAYKSGDAEQILASKNLFYDVLFEGAGSETLSSMIGMLHVRIWRWRALGLGHPKRTAERWKESIAGLRGMLEAIKKHQAELAEKLMREEATKAAAEIMRLLANTEEGR
ncbi:MAG: GntR family transcriptional regulator [Acidobacteriia bacterium]|nr:GntR family transcriptional regulator [Terriglobia bacterium]